MADEKSRLDQDIEEKLVQLRLMLNKPAYYLTEAISSIINEIDYDTERILMNLSSDQETKRDELNSTRDEFIRILRAIEKSLLDDLNLASFSKIDFGRLDKKFERFAKRSYKDGELDEIEDEYVELAIDILAETYQLEKKIYDFQTFCYLPSLNKDEIGNLIYLSDDYLDPEELNVLKQSFWEDLCFEEIFDAFQVETNRSLAVGVSRKSILSRNVIIIYGLPRIYRLGYHLKSKSKVIHYGETPTRVDLRLPDEDIKLVREIVARHFDSNVEILDRLALDALDASQNPFKQDRVYREYLSLHDNRLRSLDLEFYAAHSPKLVFIRINDNRLESFDHNSLARFENLGALHMVDSFLPDTHFSLDFLASLSKLSCLQMTLPDLPEDFDFRSLSVLKLSWLTLHSAASLDFNKERPRLSKRLMNQLAAISTLDTLELTFFDLGTIDEDTFKGFRSLRSLTLINNRIDAILAGAFANRLARVNTLSIDGIITCDLPDDLFKDQRELKYLSLINNRLVLSSPTNFSGVFENMTHLQLDHNRISKLPKGLFEPLINLNHLSLQSNRIRQLGRGLFDKLHKLKYLYLDDNPLEMIAPNAFVGLWKLEWLSLNNCRLRTIKHSVFARMNNLLELWLNGNRIEAFEVETKKSDLMIKGPLKTARLVMVKQHLFIGLKRLKKLHLNGNKLTKLDLNCFANLRQLRALNLANNSIDELNIVSSRLRMLGKLNLANNRLSSIGLHAFSKSTRLVKLDLSHNRLKSLDENFFEPFGSLESLSLNDNRLVMPVADTTFPVSLRVLKLYNNERIEFENDAFRRMPMLKMIHMDLYASVDTPQRSADGSEDDEDAWDVNSVEFFPPSKEHILSLHKPDSDSLATLLQRPQNQPFFASILALAMHDGSLETLEGLELGARFGSLEKLVQSRNRLRTVEKSWFDAMPNLENLDLSGNLIETLDDPSVFQGLGLLFALNLSGNKLRSVHRRLFNGMFKLETLDLSNNYLSGIDCGPFRGLFNLEELSLSGNGIGRLDVACLLRSCRKLESLDLANNLLDHASVNETAMSEENALNLKELILASNRLEKMDFVRGLYRLEKLDLSRNKIDSLASNGVNLLGRLVNLKHLDLSHNQILTIDEKTLEYFDSMHTFLYLTNNPIKAPIHD